MSQSSPALQANSLRSHRQRGELRVTSVAVLLAAGKARRALPGEPTCSSQKPQLYVSWLPCIKKLNLSCSIFFGFAHLIFLNKDRKEKKKAYYFLGDLNGLSQRCSNINLNL